MISSEVVRYLNTQNIAAPLRATTSAALLATIAHVSELSLKGLQPKIAGLSGARAQQVFVFLLLGMQNS